MTVTHIASVALATILVFALLRWRRWRKATALAYDAAEIIADVMGPGHTVLTCRVSLLSNTCEIEIEGPGTIDELNLSLTTESDDHEK